MTASNHHKNFSENGFVVARRVFEQETLIGLADAFRALLAQQIDGDKGEQDLENLILDCESVDHQIVYQASVIVGSSLAAQILLGRSGIEKSLADFLGTGPAGLHATPLFIQVQIPGDRRFDYDWHQECGFYPWCDNMLTVWFPLCNPSTSIGGTMAVIPRSHKGGLRESKKYLNDASFLQIRPPVSEVEEREAMPIEIDVGDACIFDGNLIHESRPNNSGIPRINGILRFIDMKSLKKPRMIFRFTDEDLKDDYGRLF